MALIDRTKNKTLTQAHTLDMIEKMTLAYGASDTVKSFTIDTRAKLVMMVVKVPNFTASITGTIAIANPYGDTIFSLASIAKNATTVIQKDGDNNDLRIPLVGVNTVSFTLSGAPGGSGGDVEITAYTE